MFRTYSVAVLLSLFIPWTAAAQIEGDFSKTFDSFIFSMTSEITMTSDDDVTEVGVKLQGIKLTYDKSEDAYLGEGDLLHTGYSFPLGEACWIEERIYRSDRFYIRLEVDEYFDAAPDVRLFMRMRGTTAFTMPGEGAVVGCLVQNDTLRYTVPAVPVWAAGWFIIRDDVGESPSQPHGWPIKDIKVEGWEITGIEQEDFRIHKDLDHTYTEPDGESFREKASYVIEPCIKYEIGFEMGTDNYTFSNDASNVWPESYWSQFDYSVEGETFLELTGNPEASIFPDWYAFSRAFGEEQTYRSVFPKVHRPRALLIWRALNREFSGTCYGFTYSSLLHYCGYRSALPQPLGMLGPEDAVLEELHEKHCYQLSREGIQHTIQYSGQRPKEMVKALIASFKEDRKANVGLGILLPGAGHSMLPISVTSCFDDDADEILTSVEVWDNDDPSASRRFTVNETQNVIVGDNGNLNGGFFADIPADAYQPPYPSMYKAGGGVSRPTLLSAERTDVYYDGSGSALMTVPGHAAVDLNAMDLEAGEEMHPIYIRTGAEPIIPGYSVATTIADELRVAATAGSGKESLTSFGAAGVIDLVYEAPSGSGVQVDFNNLDLRMDLATDDGLQDGVMQFVRTGEDADLLARISDLQFTGQESIAAWMGDGAAMLHLQNRGAQKSYTFALMKFGETFESSGSFSALDIEADASHVIVVGSPDSLRTTRIELRVDRGSDGSVHEVRVLRHYGTVDVRTPAVVSEDLRAWPAPWTPGARPLQIRYALQRSASVRLVIYNTLQQEIAEIVPPQPHVAGSMYAVSWNGDDRYGRAVPSGTYFYVLEAIDGSRALGKISVLRK